MLSEGRNRRVFWERRRRTQELSGEGVTWGITRYNNNSLDLGNLNTHTYTEAQRMYTRLHKNIQQSNRRRMFCSRSRPLATVARLRVARCPLQKWWNTLLRRRPKALLIPWGLVRIRGGLESILPGPRVLLPPPPSPEI